MRTRFSALAALALGATLALAAFASVGATDKAMVRVMHASPDAPAVDVYVNDAKVEALTNVPFKAVSDYLMLDAGTYKLGIKPAGAAASDPYVLSASATVEAGKAYTVAATGPLASIAFTILVDNTTASSTTAKLRIVHFSPDAPAVDVLTQDGATKLVSNLAFPTASKYLSLPGGSYDVKVCATADNSVCPLDPPALTLEDGKNYTVFAVNSLASIEAVVAVDGTVAATVPPTSTVPADGGSAPILPALLVAFAAVVGVGLFGRRLAGSRTR